MPQPQNIFTPILSRIGIAALNPMQEAVINSFKTTDNLVLLSDTGTGKTLAFLLSIAGSLQTTNGTTVAMIIVPSRELALQIEKVYKSLVLTAKITCCYGGHKREIEENNLVEAPALIVGTPGRIADHIRRGSIKTSVLDTLILDEFDKLLEQNFNEEMAFIISALPALQKRLLVSATELETLPDFLQMPNATTINFLTDNKPALLDIKTLQCTEKDKLEEAFRLLCILGAKSAIIFCNHREAVERVSKGLSEKGIVNTFYHGAMEQRERDMALCKFRNGTVDFLVTTDLASRGLDIFNVRYIIHYHLPLNEESYTHRNGRTARMDASGSVIIMLGPEEKLPTYIEPIETSIQLPNEATIPEKPKWTTLYIAAGKKDKINKIDIVGFLTNKAKLKKEAIGLIEVKDFFSFVAVKKNLVSDALHRIKNEKIKNKKVNITVAK